ncbi:hypothetical protein K461DRAFT_96628 [Myriangium duriaei CBS 260.36]|uniref:Uncharacterized protein n=1 Tax=Myriangium duriaei CBS 260.36 TaxID=1168546 RepID=A0A9P4JAM7_9PEZI|nr:hypothetical protein K461DRAFT_96628 [Myriangium duriaei CBS 260.36]
MKVSPVVLLRCTTLSRAPSGLSSQYDPKITSNYLKCRGYNVVYLLSTTVLRIAEQHRTTFPGRSVCRLTAGHQLNEYLSSRLR